MRCFFNDKPWITNNVKDILNRKRRTFKEGDWEELKCVRGRGWGGGGGGGNLRHNWERQRRNTEESGRSFRAASWRRSGMAWKTSQATRRRAATWKRAMLWKQMRVTCFLTGLITQPLQQETMDYIPPLRETKMCQLEWLHVWHCGFQHRRTAGTALSPVFFTMWTSSITLSHTKRLW